MIQDVKLGTHIIGTFMYAISIKCTFLLSFENSILKTCFFGGVERGVAARRAQMVWPMIG